MGYGPKSLSHGAPQQLTCTIIITHHGDLAPPASSGKGPQARSVSPLWLVFVLCLFLRGTGPLVTTLDNLQHHHLLLFSSFGLCAGCAPLPAARRSREPLRALARGGGKEIFWSVKISVMGKNFRGKNFREKFKKMHFHGNFYSRKFLRKLYQV